MSKETKAYFVGVKEKSIYVHYNEKEDSYYISNKKIGACIWLGLKAAQKFCKSITNTTELEPILLDRDINIITKIKSNDSSRGN